MKRIKAAIFAVCLLFVLLCMTPAAADEADVPSIFVGDEEWYRDAIAPLITRGGRDYIPVEVFGMFDYITVTTPRENNILVHNTTTGEYISVLFGNRSAAVNGTIVSSIGVFMEGEIYYVDALAVAEAVGLRFESISSGEGTRTVRILDDDASYTLNELISPFFTQDDNGYSDGSDGADAMDGEPKRIYVLCRQSATGMNTPEFSAMELLCQYELNYTAFIHDTSRTDDVIRAVAQGEYGVYPAYFWNMDDASAADMLNNDTKKITKRYTDIILDLQGDEAPRGYYAITPDFTVNGVLSAKYVFGQIEEYFKTHSYCTLYLTDCWNSEQMIILLSELDGNEIITSNLAGSRH